MKIEIIGHYNIGPTTTLNIEDMWLNIIECWRYNDR